MKISQIILSISIISISLTPKVSSACLGLCVPAGQIVKRLTPQIERHLTALAQRVNPLWQPNESTRRAILSVYHEIFQTQDVRNNAIGQQISQALINTLQPQEAQDLVRLMLGDPVCTKIFKRLRYLSYRQRTHMSIPRSIALQLVDLSFTIIDQQCPGVE